MITVRIHFNELLRHPALVESYILDRLRECKIPVVGYVKFSGVSRGRLSYYQDFVTGDMVYSWESKQ